mgnify:CR=1 FL=1
MSGQQSYLKATRHPLSCLLFLLPFLVIYEIGVLQLGGQHPEAVRNGADHWVRQAVGSLGVRQLFLIPILLAVLFAIRAYQQRQERPKDLVGTWVGMMFESVSFALILWGISRSLGPVFETMRLSAHSQSRLITFLGAGIYEETLFRLILFGGLIWFFKKTEVPFWIGVTLASLISAGLFSLAHHVGPAGEAFEAGIFLFRLIAGLYFAMIYQFRGFGVVVGAHACYDIAVGIVI